eukprot:75303-Pelagomonas_calceolata.AAC.1
MYSLLYYVWNPTGITGIALALAGARVMLTDLPHILPLTRENVTANLRPIHAAMVAEHRWGSDATPLLQLVGDTRVA